MPDIYYQKSIAKLAQTISYWEKKSAKFVVARSLLAVFLIALVSLAFANLGPRYGFGSLFVGVIIFGIVISRHQKLDNFILKLKRFQNIKRTQKGRFDLNWEEIPPEDYVPEENNSSFVTDFDLLGKNSVFRLLDFTFSSKAKKLLFGYLTQNEPKLEEIIERQNLVKELKDLYYFREKMFLEAYDFKQKKYWSADTLETWLKLEPIEGLKKNFQFALSTIIITGILFLVSSLGLMGDIFWKITFMVYIIHFFSNNRITKVIFVNSLAVEDTMEKLAKITQTIERHDFSNKPNLQTFLQVFQNSETKPSLYLKKIKQIVSAASVQKNPFLWFLLNSFLPWDFFVAVKLEKYQKLIAKQADTWLEKIYELEALSSLANFAFLNPEYNFPALKENDNQNILAVKQLGHPLLKKATKIKNDFSIAKDQGVFVLTGSNMAGKSTFLRSLGINLRLAYAGTVTDTQTFSASLMEMYSCIKVSDSVNDGISYFYAEVKRLRLIKDNIIKNPQLPVFFMIDEIFKGTNNKERIKGSMDFIKFLSAHNCYGFISTHDLDIAREAETFGNVRNYHFRDEVTNNQMSFDYKIREGICTSTNAVKIMKMEGLPIFD